MSSKYFTNHRIGNGSSKYDYCPEQFDIDIKRRQEDGKAFEKEITDIMMQYAPKISQHDQKIVIIHVVEKLNMLEA